MGITVQNVFKLDKDNRNITVIRDSSKQCYVIPCGDSYPFTIANGDFITINADTLSGNPEKNVDFKIEFSDELLGLVYLVTQRGEETIETPQRILSNNLQWQIKVLSSTGNKEEEGSPNISVGDDEQ
jgi:hypothetical protein